MVKRSRNNKQLKGGNPLTIILTFGAFIAAIYFLKKSLSDLKNETVRDVNQIRIDANKDINQKFAAGERLLQQNIPKPLQDKSDIRNREEIARLEREINDLYSKVESEVSNERKSEFKQKEINIDSEITDCKVKPDNIRCLNDLLSRVGKLHADYGYRMNLGQVHQQNAVNLEKLSSDEEINNAQRQILELRAREAMERERTNKKRSLFRIGRSRKGNKKKRKSKRKTRNKTNTKNKRKTKRRNK